MVVLGIVLLVVAVFLAFCLAWSLGSLKVALIMLLAASMVGCVALGGFLVERGQKTSEKR